MNVYKVTYKPNSWNKDLQHYIHVVSSSVEQAAKNTTKGRYNSKIVTAVELALDDVVVA
jgi:hypothetical protein